LNIVNSVPIEFTFNSIDCDTLFETIKSHNNTIYNISYHQQRVNQAYRDFFKTEPKFEIKDIVKPKSKLTRVKLVYNIDGVVEIGYFDYKPKEIKSLMLIEVGNFDYNFKYLNRAFFEELYKTYSGVDEFILTKNGYITDCTIANLAFYDSGAKRWVSPSKPLLNGTTRQRLLDEKKIFLDDIHYTNLKNYSKIVILNAMVGFYKL